MSEVREQDKGVAYLKRVVANECKIPLLLVGPEGVGKRFSVMAAIKEDFSGGDPGDNQCLQVDRGTHPDLIILTPDLGKDIGVDEMREALTEATLHPSVARRRYIVVDGADRLSEGAANAILKVLEEPPKNTRFLLISNSLEKVIPTIISRCGVVRYNRLSEPFISAALSQLTDDSTKATVYTRLSEGSVGRAVQYLGSNRIIFRNRVMALLKTAVTGDLSTLFSAIDELATEKKSAELILAFQFLERIVTDLYLISYAPERIANMDLHEELTLLRERLGPIRLAALRREINVVQERLPSKPNLAYQIKNCFCVAISER